MKNIYDLDNKEISARIGKMLKTARIAANMTQKDLSEKSAVALMTISGFETGRSSVSFNTLIQLLRTLGMLDMLDFPSIDFASLRLGEKQKQRVRPAAEPTTHDATLTYSDIVETFLNNKQSITLEAITTLKTAEATATIDRKLRSLQSQADKEIAYWMNKNIDIEPYITSAGYKKKHSTQRWRRFEKDNNVFLITDANTIWNAKTSKNTNLFDFIIENYPKEDPHTSDTKHMIDAVLSNQGLKIFVKQTPKATTTKPKPEAPNTETLCAFASLRENYRLEPLNIQQNYLLTRHITPETLKLPLFNGAILQGNKKTLDVRYNNVIYPFKTHPTHETAQMVTLLQQYGKKIETEGKHIDKIFAPGNGKSMSLWFSNMPDTVKFLYIFENPLDALSHCQLRAPENALYCATGGNPAKLQIALINDLCAELKALPVLCFDNDFSGCRFDTVFLSSLAPDKLSITASGENAYNVKLANISTVKPTLKSFMFVKKIKIIEQEDDTLTACIDTIDKASQFNRFINNTFLNTKASFEKSTLKDYNDDLKHTKTAK